MTLSDLIPNYARATPSLACEAMGRLLAHLAGNDPAKAQQLLRVIASVAEREMRK